MLQRERRKLPAVGPSSDDLHPKTGARFVLTRTGDAYRVEVYLPDALLESTLSWDGEGRPQLEPSLPEPAAGETLKLARVLKRTPKDRLTRWRGLDPDGRQDEPG